MTCTKKIKKNTGQSVGCQIGIGFIKHATMLLIVTAFFSSLISCSTVSPPPPGDVESFSAYTEGVPGGVVGNIVEISARVAAIDYFNRMAVLLGPDGKQHTVKVGPEAINFDKIQVGDLVLVTVATQLVVYLDKENHSSVGGSAAVVALGAQAGGLAVEAREIIGTVSKIDHERRIATLQFQDGSIREFQVRDDIDLTRHQVGEQVVFHITEMVAIDIEKQ